MKGENYVLQTYGVDYGPVKKDEDYPTTIIEEVRVDFSDVLIYSNAKRNDCIVLTFIESTGRIDSITYFHDYEYVTESLSEIF